MIDLKGKGIGSNGTGRFDVNVLKFSAAVDSVHLKVKYLDCSTNPAGDTAYYERMCELDTNVEYGTSTFYHRGQLACRGTMKILETELQFFKPADSTYYCKYQCLSMPVYTGQALVMQASGTAESYEICLDPSSLITLYYYPCSETFESANFGEGRMVFNTTAMATIPFTYEYYLKDHLGSTRMVVSDAGDVIEATMYQPYGTMSEVPGASTSAIAVREKFTGKEFDEEGGTGSGVDGMRAFYFGARYYDPEVGVWGSTDPAGEFWNSYRYTTNPITGCSY